MKISEAEKWLMQELMHLHKEGEAAAITALLMEAITGYNRTEIVTKKNELITTQGQRLLQGYLKRLQKHEPIQYILNKAFFYGLELFVNRAVLIPRPETEELVHWIITDVKALGKNVFQKAYGEADTTDSFKILDVGTGSGCIALALKNALPKAEVWGCDDSDKALNIARRNGAGLNIRVDFQGVDFLDEQQQKLLPTVDLIVSNPPYIPASHKTTIADNVRNWEPHTALFVPNNDPFVFYKALARFAEKHLHPQGSIYMEVEESAGHNVPTIFEAAGYTGVELKKDMQEKTRMVKAIKKN